MSENENEEEFDFDSILNTDTPIEEDDFSPTEKPVEQKEFFNVKEKAFDTLRSLLVDSDFRDSKYIDNNSGNTVVDIMDELLANDGNLAQGRTSNDGFIMHSCPKHTWAPIHLCVNCSHWKSSRPGKPFGVCKATPDDEKNPDYDEKEKYSYKEAKQKEIAFRREKGYNVD